MPKHKEISTLAFMEGDWNIKLEFMGHRGTYQERETPEPCIKFASTNLLQEQISYENRFPNKLSINFTYDVGTKKYRIAAFNDFISTFDMFQRELNDNVLVMESTQVTTPINQILQECVANLPIQKLTATNLP